MDKGQRVRPAVATDDLDPVTLSSEWSRVLERDGAIVGSICMNRIAPLIGEPGVWIYGLQSKGDDPNDAAVLMKSAIAQAREWGLAGNVRANVTNPKLLTKAIRRGFVVEAYIIKGEL